MRARAGQACQWRRHGMMVAAQRELTGRPRCWQSRGRRAPPPTAWEEVPQATAVKQCVRHSLGACEVQSSRRSRNGRGHSLFAGCQALHCDCPASAQCNAQHAARSPTTTTHSRQPPRRKHPHLWLGEAVGGLQEAQTLQHLPHQMALVLQRQSGGEDGRGSEGSERLRVPSM